MNSSMAVFFRTNGLRTVAVFLLAFSVLAFAGCAGMQSSSEKQMVDRAQALCDAIVSGKLETAYGYYAPGDRSGTSMVDFAIEVSQRRVNYTSAEYVSHQCEEDRCAVSFRVGFRVLAAVPGMKVFDSSQVIEDTWIRTDGNWWYLPKK